MREVFNYRRALREPKKIRQITDYYYLPFTIELIPAVNFLLFLGITFFIGWMIRRVYPYTFSNTWFIFLMGIPLLLTWFVTKIKPEGKNIYVYMYDYVKYLVAIKIPRRKFCNGEEVVWMNDRKITFKQCVWVVEKKNGKTETSNKNDQKQYALNENGRRVGILSDKE
ncbi:conjugal transfer protein [Oceanobacillus profundus]|uniref:conjugal transfer protein n=1 Tax=Oceanobacillus profundus TaxID=372463 RepID=UPI0026E388D8|nr:conjugal transfer protein [Oceanobacillus profundus]MDO6450543.1 conjugal transfer protein [Oceanobacillus profundus]